ncbi:glycosyl transferase family protein [Sphingomonas sp.]|uniref:glycosyl transferase family protein n=1 Tax=Sphingomonas sp. TaxID=28214 RepID=UPI00179A62B4|nr:glycosyl transferase family protein [Sphingomonas sp.]MBA4760533.1 glycosyl transferase family protein [Sphingomonas sp.]
MGQAILFAIDGIAREAMLFAAIGFLIGGIDDLLIDLAYGIARIRARLRGEGSRSLAVSPLPMALFIPAWDEAAVIGAMLRATLTRYGDADYRIYVGTYPNDAATIAAVAEVAASDPRVRLVIGPTPGPTTKADCLNALWRALLRDEVAGEPCAAVVLHDAEDLVHPDELAVFAAWLTDYDAVQLPVQPLADARSPLVAGHYLDEFAESHGKNLVVREALGAAIPFAGVGCAIRRAMLGRIADSRGGQPFDAASLTEDYELGLTVAALGGRTRFVRARDAAGQLIAVCAYFPASLNAAVRQKARWLTGIALAGWDRVGWQRGGSIGEHWMRMRDRRATLAIPVLAIAYLALVAWGVSLAGHWLVGTPVPTPDVPVGWLLVVNAGLLGWRVAMRVAFTGAAHGPVQALLAVPRVLVANLIALLAARRAIAIYWPTLRGVPARWDKTAHHFPDSHRNAA